MNKTAIRFNVRLALKNLLNKYDSNWYDNQHLIDTMKMSKDDYAIFINLDNALQFIREDFKVIS